MDAIGMDDQNILKGIALYILGLALQNEDTDKLDLNIKFAN